MTSEKIIRNYLSITGMYYLSASIIWGVNTLFLLDAGLTLLETFIANSVFTAAMALFEIPTGVLADTRGRRISFLLSIFILALGTYGYVLVAAWGGGLLWFSIVSAVLGLGFTFYSGAVEAWLVDALQASDFSGSMDTIFARGGMVIGAAMLVGTVSGGFLGSVNLAWPFIFRVVLLTALLIFAYFTMHDIGYEPKALQWSHLGSQMGKVARASFEHGWGQPSARLLMIMKFIQGSFFIWAWYAWQPYFLELLKQNAVWITGIIAALIAVAMMLGNMLVTWLTKLCGKRTTLLIWASAVFTLSMVGVGLTSNFYSAVSLFVLAMAASGVIDPVRQAYLHEIIPSSERAAIISFNSLMDSAGGVVGQNALGYVSQIRSIGAGYISGGLFTGLIIPVFFMLRQRGDEADLIVGTASAGTESACPAQGLPLVSNIDSAKKTSVRN